MTQKKVKILASDIGGVIALFKHGAPSGTLRDFVDMLYYHTKVPSHHFQKFLEVEQGTPEFDFMLGNFTPKQFYWELRKIANAYHGGKRAPFPSFRLFKKAWCNIFIPNWELVDTLRDLSAVHKIVLASNIDTWHYEFVVDFCCLTFVDRKKSMVSFRDHLLKPDPAFFKLLIKKCGVEPGEIFFFDDMAENCQSAFNCGIEVHQFVDNQTLFKEIEKRTGVRLIDG